MILLTAPGSPVLTGQALKLVAELHHLAPLQPAPPPPEWRVAEVPAELLARQVELVVPANDAAESRAGIAAQPDALVLDFDDTFSPTWRNVLQAHEQLVAIAEAFPGVLMLRPRGLHLPEGHAWLDGAPVNAGLFDLAVALGSLAGQVRAGRTVYLYLPKIESAQDAARWQQAITHVERALGLPVNSVRVGIQIESFPAALAADAILGVLRDRAFGLNAGRWDYFCSLVRHCPELVLPERARMHMGLPYLSAYARLLVQVARARGAQAVGGTAALVPGASDPQPVLERVRADKRLEARAGYAAAWAGHLSLVPAVREVFREPVEVDTGPPVREADLKAIPVPGVITLEGVRENIALSVAYLRAWRSGVGNLERHGRLEDTATVEFARAQLWQWVHHQQPLDDGTALHADRYRELSATEGRSNQGDHEVVGWLDGLVLADRCPAYFARTLYPALIHPS